MLSRDFPAPCVVVGWSPRVCQQRAKLEEQNMPTPFNSIPLEVIENIAFFAVASNPLGPPRELTPLLLLNRRSHASLSNPHLYARIFSTKFDTTALMRRLGPPGGAAATTAPKLAAELRRRFVQLGRLRARIGCTVGGSSLAGEGEGVIEMRMRALHEMLWTAYLMMLENDGKNERQLREYARLDGWLRAFWFAEDGASCARIAIRDNAWPPNNDFSAVTMWLFWFLLRPGEFLSLCDVCAHSHSLIPLHSLLGPISFC